MTLKPLDITFTPDLVQALTCAALWGEKHGHEGREEASTTELRRHCAVVRWMGGDTAQFSTHLRALRDAYKAGYHNGEALRKGRAK